VEKLSKKNASSPAFLKCKANEAKKTLPWIQHLLAQAADGNQEHQWMSACGWALGQYYTLIDQNGRYLPPDELRRLQDVGQVFLQCYSALSSAAQAHIDQQAKIPSAQLCAQYVHLVFLPGLRQPQLPHDAQVSHVRSHLGRGGARVQPCALHLLRRRGTLLSCLFGVLLSALLSCSC
jgi:hypothetical protein